MFGRLGGVSVVARFGLERRERSSVQMFWRKHQLHSLSSPVGKWWSYKDTSAWLYLLTILNVGRKQNVLVVSKVVSPNTIRPETRNFHNPDRRYQCTDIGGATRI